MGFSSLLAAAPSCCLSSKSGNMPARTSHRRDDQATEEKVESGYDVSQQGKYDFAGDPGYNAVSSRKILEEKVGQTTGEDDGCPVHPGRDASLCFRAEADGASERRWPCQVSAEETFASLQDKG